MKFIQSIVRAIDGLNTRIGHAVSWLTTILVLVVCYDVFTRYFLRKSSVGVKSLNGISSQCYFYLQQLIP